MAINVKDTILESVVVPTVFYGSVVERERERERRMGRRLIRTT